MSEHRHPDVAPLRRRELLAAGVTLGALFAVPVAVWESPAIDIWLHPARQRRKLLDRLSDLLIPDTDTPGALATGVPDWVMLALRHGLDGTLPPGATTAIADDEEPPASRHLLAPIKRALDDATGDDFLSVSADRQHAALAAIDKTAFAPGHDKDPWHTIKELILTGYYTSEIGGSQELRYELVPGRWDPDIPLTPDMRAFSSDWTAVEFG